MKRALHEVSRTLLEEISELSAGRQQLERELNRFQLDHSDCARIRASKAMLVREVRDAKTKLVAAVQVHLHCDERVAGLGRELSVVTGARDEVMQKYTSLSTDNQGLVQVAREHKALLAEVVALRAEAETLRQAHTADEVESAKLNKEVRT
jgi:hypothetical protein